MKVTLKTGFLMLQGKREGVKTGPKGANACVSWMSGGQKPGALTAVAALLLAQQLTGQFLQVDPALSKLGLHQHQVVLSLLSAGRGPLDLYPALLQLLLAMP